MADNCIDVYYRMDRYYLTGNSIDFALNYKAQGGDVTEMTVLGNDVFADALVERLKQRNIPLRVLKRIDRPTGMAKMDLVDGDKSIWNFTATPWRRLNFQERTWNLSRALTSVCRALGKGRALSLRCASRADLGLRLFETTGAALQRCASPLSGLRLFLLRQG